MDREQARFILQSFRPDGADASDADFAEALQLVAKDRQLGEWLADERATDAAFAAALGAVEIPEELRQHILVVMHGKNPADPSMDAAMDTALFDAIDQLQPPAGLRAQIIAAMNVQQSQHEEIPDHPDKLSNADNANNVVTGWFAGWSRVAAIAAALVIGAFVALQVTTPSSSADGFFASYEVQRHAGNIIDASSRLDVEGAGAERVNSWLVSRNLPTPASIPQRLRAIENLGCKEIRLPGDIGTKKASIICFHEKGQDPVYLVIVKSAYISDPGLPRLAEVSIKDCYHCPKTSWNVVRWRDAENTYILLAKKEEELKAELLEYF